MKAEPIRVRNGIVGEHLTDEVGLHGGTERKAKPVRAARPNGYVLGDLDTARAAFQHTTELSFARDSDPPAGELDAE
jgi:hypothetical protein